MARWGACRAFLSPIDAEHPQSHYRHAMVFRPAGGKPAFSSETYLVRMVGRGCSNATDE